MGQQQPHESDLDPDESDLDPDESDLDPGEVEPTDNSTGSLVDLNRVEEVEHTPLESPAEPPAAGR